MCTLPPMTQEGRQVRATQVLGRVLVPWVEAWVRESVSVWEGGL